MTETHKEGPLKTLFGIDTTANISARAAGLKAAGASFVCRYLAPNAPSTRWKRVGADEVAACKRNGLGLALVWETTADRVLGGRAAGEADASAALSELAELGLVGPGVVYFAIDFDAVSSQQHAIDEYFRGANAVLRPHGIDAAPYGGYWPCKRLLDAGIVHYAWQTYAWSGGLWDKRAGLRQYSNDHTLAGISCDFDHALGKAWGDWTGAHHRKPKPKLPLWALFQGKNLVWHRRVKRLPGWVKEQARTLANHHWRKTR